MVDRLIDDPRHVVGELTVRRLAHRDVLEDVSFSLDTGSLLVVLGENGAGKTTIFRCLLGMQRHGGDVLSTVGGVERVVPEEGFFSCILDETALYQRWSVRANLEYHLDKPIDQDPWVRRLVDSSLLTRRAAKLSHGQSRLVLLAIAFASEAPVLLLDEFANGLDETARLRVRSCISEARACGRSAISTGHDLSVFEGIELDVAVLQGGRLGPTEHVSTDERIEDVRARHFRRTSS